MNRSRRLAWMGFACVAAACNGGGSTAAPPPPTPAALMPNADLHRATLHLKKVDGTCRFDKATPKRIGKSDQVDVDDVIQWKVQENCDGEPTVEITRFKVIECDSTLTDEDGDPLDPDCSRKGKKLITCTVDEEGECFKYWVRVNGVEYDPELETRGATLIPPAATTPPAPAPSEPPEPEAGDGEDADGSS